MTKNARTHVGGGWFLGALPIALQLIVWSHTVFGGTALTLRFAITSMIDTATTLTDRALQDVLKPKDADRFWPGTKTKIKDIGIVPKSKLHKLDIEKAELENGLKPLRGEAAEIKLHADNAKIEESLIETTSKRYTKALGDIDKISKGLGWEPIGGNKETTTPPATRAPRNPNTTRVTRGNRRYPLQRGGRRP
ncbi:MULTISPECIES: hypothetical protein [Nocardiopsidaceae]|uniref:Uncharacterized protein n=1 Tax=Streptomonospora nanhaiensis TaxID=1323731 RepID=A0ABY6YNN9_9ACTN|nr:hypothetical protein [Streptomonospora nanhaiensis]WAE73924.1 hypothetical protein OUQ99_01995 [Streptomonospora nanhaiensis]